MPTGPAARCDGVGRSLHPTSTSKATTAYGERRTGEGGEVMVANAIGSGECPDDAILHMNIMICLLKNDAEHW